MADDYDYDIDDAYEYDDDGWMYVEDEYGLVDELADMAIADPGYAGTNHEIALESYEYDVFDYWDDIEYADDAYWESGGRPAPADGKSKEESAGVKRKRDESSLASVPDKKRKGFTTRNAAAKGGQDVVLYMSQEQQCHASLRRPPAFKEEGSYAFIPDWQKRYAEVDGRILKMEMPFDMQRAAEAQEDVTPEKAQKYVNAAAYQMEDEDLEDDEDEEGGEGDDSELPSLAPEILERVLKQKLAESGLTDSETEAALLQALQKMLTSGSKEKDVDTDGAASDLARLLLSNTSKGGGGGLASWLENMGVDLNVAEEDHLEDNMDPMNSPILRSGAGRHGPQASAPDSTIAGISRRGGEPARSSSKVGASRVARNDSHALPVSSEPSTTPDDANTDASPNQKTFRNTVGNAEDTRDDREVHGYASPRSGESDMRASDPRPAAYGSQRRKRKAVREEVDTHDVQSNAYTGRAMKKVATARNRSARAATGD